MFLEAAKTNDCGSEFGLGAAMLGGAANNKTGTDVRFSMIEQIRQQLTEHTPRRLAMDVPEAAVLIPLTRCNKEPEIVFTRRSSRLNTHSGEVAFPGGKRDPGDLDLSYTALRESNEEIGLPYDRVELIGTTGDVVSRFGIKVTPFIGVIEQDVELIANPDELESIFRVPVSYFLEAERLRTDELRYKNNRFYVPAWQYQDYQIWGLTAIMLVEFLNVALGAGIPLNVPQTLPSIPEKGDWSRQG
ncbi:CoA pyrophosphatase [Parendozoicomonas haliclonae]|uniref:Putative NUDIX hydrolase n=1 Tax=Parendozoicomonas haliclonae TaxID=1960125 RepID=A0A1X7AQ23_9GAMM|nr:CoA pyrophosphatase [Parendozoicomonas haliclonae]SMA50414.1 putative NUDIX hydrolase [Parendozoicomonas haliclonae]